MNENVEIGVETAVGTSDSGLVGSIVAQGSPEAVIVSSNNVDV